MPFTWQRASRRQRISGLVALAMACLVIALGVTGVARYWAVAPLVVLFALLGYFRFKDLTR